MLLVPREHDPDLVGDAPATREELADNLPDAGGPRMLRGIARVDLGERTAQLGRHVRPGLVVEHVAGVEHAPEPVVQQDPRGVHVGVEERLLDVQGGRLLHHDHRRLLVLGCGPIRLALALGLQRADPLDRSLAHTGPKGRVKEDVDLRRLARFPCLDQPLGRKRGFGFGLPAGERLDARLRRIEPCRVGRGDGADRLCELDVLDHHLHLGRRAGGCQARGERLPPAGGTSASVARRVTFAVTSAPASISASTASFRSRGMRWRSAHESSLRS